MKESGEYSIILGLISIGLSIYFVEDLTIRIGLLIVITITLVYFSFRGYVNQIKKNTQSITEFNKKLDLHNRLNKIENEINILKGVKK